MKRQGTPKGARIWKAVQVWSLSLILCWAFAGSTRKQAGGQMGAEMCSVPPTWSRKTTRNGGGVAACPQVAACPLGVCCARASGRLLWSACACGGINTNLLARERRPGRWEAERASRAMRRATAGVGGRDRRDGPGVRRAEAGGSGGGVGPRPPRAGPGRRLGGANPNRAQRAPGGSAGASPGAGGRWGAKLGPATCCGARGPGGGGRGL